MPTVRFSPIEKSISVSPGTDLLDAATRAGVPLASPCGANGNCGKCVVKVEQGSLQNDFLGLLSQEAKREGFVQACRSKIGEEDVTLFLPGESIGLGQFTDDREDLKRIDTRCFPQSWQLHPMITLIPLTVTPPKAEDGLSDYDRLLKALKEKIGENQFECSLSILRGLAGKLREENGNLSLIFTQDDQNVEILKIESGIDTSPVYGLGIDLGTTSVSVQLVEFPDNKIIETETDYNQQLSCGADIISRINYSRRSDRLDELQELAIQSINSLILSLVTKSGIDKNSIYSAVISGNTTMIHLLLGLNPEYIRLEPYTPTLFSVPMLKANELGLQIFPSAPIYCSPAVGSYVGGDITAGLLCTDMMEQEDEISLFLDIGTNGELVIGNRDFLMACACSAGPAFEGGGVSCGMRAAQGAIEAVEIDGETGASILSVIGGGKAKGICGSGIISLIAELFRKSWLDPSGKLSRNRPSEYIRLDGRKAEYLIVPRELDSEGEELLINEQEIENIIRSKAAIFSAYSLLFNQVGIGFDDISKFYVAGGFGRYLNLEDAITIGLLPDLPRDKFHFLGNTSLIGSYMLLISKEYQSIQNNLANRMTYIDLSNDPGYMEQYTAALFLPHTNLALFP